MHAPPRLPATSRLVSPKPRPLPPRDIVPSYQRWSMCNHSTMPTPDNRSKNVTLSFRLCPADGASLQKKVPPKRLILSRFCGHFSLEGMALCQRQQLYALEFWYDLILLKPGCVNKSHIALFNLCLLGKWVRWEKNQNNCQWCWWLMCNQPGETCWRTGVPFLCYGSFLCRLDDKLCFTPSPSFTWEILFHHHFFLFALILLPPHHWTHPECRFAHIISVLIDSIYLLSLTFFCLFVPCFFIL